MAEKKKPKPGPSTGGSSTSRIKRPKGSQPLTLGTGGLRTGKVSKKQMAGTRKVVGAIAAVTPVGRVAKGADKLIGKTITKSTRKKWSQVDIPKPTIKTSATKQSIKERKLTKKTVPPTSSRTYQPSWTANEKLAAKNKALANSAKGMVDKNKTLGINAGKAKAKRTASKQDFFSLPKKGKNKNLKTTMDNYYASSITGEPSRISKKVIRRKPPKPPVKKK